MLEKFPSEKTWEFQIREARSIRPLKVSHSASTSGCIDFFFRRVAQRNMKRSTSLCSLASRRPNDPVAYTHASPRKSLCIYQRALNFSNRPSKTPSIFNYLTHACLPIQQIGENLRLLNCVSSACECDGVNAKVGISFERPPKQLESEL